MRNETRRQFQVAHKWSMLWLGLWGIAVFVIEFFSYRVAEVLVWVAILPMVSICLAFYALRWWHFLRRRWAR